MTVARRRSRNPAHLARQGWRLVRAGMRRDLRYYRVQPTNLLPFMTYRCTSRCRTCSMWCRRVTRPELSLAQWQSFFGSLEGTGGLRHVEFFGGDVLLRPDVLMPLIEQVVGMGLGTSVPTNGILLDEAMAERLVASGLGSIYLSVDGVGETHDRVRGVPGAFERSRKAVEALRRARGDDPYPKIQAICTVSRFNADSFEQVLPYAVEAGFDEVAFEYAGFFPEKALAQSVIDGHRPTPYFASASVADPKQVRRIKEQVARMRSSPLAESVSLVTRNIDALTTEQMVNNWFPPRRCYMARLMVTIDPYGEVLACPFFETYSLGNIVEQPLSRIWNGPAHRRFLHAQGRGELPMCRHCILSVERNPTLWQTIVKRYLRWRGVARR